MRVLCPSSLLVNCSWSCKGSSLAGKCEQGAVHSGLHWISDTVATPIHLRLADLVPREVAEAWLKYLREELPTVAFKCSTQKQASNLGQRQMPKASSAEASLHGSESLGASALLHLLKNYTRNSDTKTAITVGKHCCICSRTTFATLTPRPPSQPVSICI